MRPRNLYPSRMLNSLDGYERCLRDNFLNNVRQAELS